MIYFAVTSLLNVLQQKDDIEGVYIYIVTKEQAGKAILSFSVFFLDVIGCYRSQLGQCSYQLIEEVFREIMDVKFIASHKADRQILQIEFELEKV